MKKGKKKKYFAKQIIQQKVKVIFLSYILRFLDLWDIHKRMSDCCLTPTQQFFSYIMLRKSYIFDKMMKMMSALY